MTYRGALLLKIREDTTCLPVRECWVKQRNINGPPRRLARPALYPAPILHTCRAQSRKNSQLTTPNCIPHSRPPSSPANHNWTLTGNKWILGRSIPPDHWLPMLFQEQLNVCIRVRLQWRWLRRYLHVPCSAPGCTDPYHCPVLPAANTRLFIAGVHTAGCLYWTPRIRHTIVWRWQPAGSPQHHHLHTNNTEGRELLRYLIPWGLRDTKLMKAIIPDNTT